MTAAQSVQALIETLPKWKDRVKVLDFDRDPRMKAIVLVFMDRGVVKYYTCLLVDTHANVMDGRVVSRSTLVTQTYDDLYWRLVREEVRKTHPGAKNYSDAGFIAADSQEYLSSFSCKGAVESSLILFVDAC